MMNVARIATFSCLIEDAVRCGDFAVLVGEQRIAQARRVREPIAMAFGVIDADAEHGGLFGAKRPSDWLNPVTSVGQMNEKSRG